ncbi:MAG: outer membrane protein assembly factor BamD [Planctomycetales bacterium]|nr:outer membrane protein assembly factor BamD [Planctomycetales bacterium]
MQHTSQYERSRSQRGPMALCVVAVWCLLPLLAGCVTPWEKSALLKDNTPNITKVQGPTERRLRNLMWLRDRENDDGSDSDSLKPLAGTDEYVAATDIYKDEQFAEAQKAFKKVAKKYKKSDIREDALFMQAEAAYQQDHYAKAHDVYAILLREYPSTRHLDVVSERLFKIGRVWLNFPEVAKLGEVQQVNYDDPKHKLPAEEPAAPSGKPMYIPNFTNKAEPLFDTPGNGVAALQAIWMNDPTGPLADDAMMLVASHHARKGNFVESDRFFQMLRETFPNSPHLQEAFLLGSHVKLMSYQGAEYEGKTLTEAELLKESTLRLYPNIEDKDRLKRELAQIDEAKAEREWGQVQFWLRKDKKRAAAVYCNQVIARFPESPFAEKARRQLEELGPQYASGAALLAPVDPPKTSLFGRATPQNSSNSTKSASAKQSYAPEASAEEAPSRWSGNPFKRSPKMTDPFEEASEDLEVRDEETRGGEASGKNDPAKKRGWLPWSPPRRLPAGSDDEAQEVEAPASGKTKL